MFVEEAGWEIPASYGDDAAERAAIRDRVAIADITARAKVDVRGAHPGGASPRRRRRRRADLTGVGRGVRGAGRGGRLIRALEPRRGPRTMVTDVTHLFAGFALAGPGAAAVLERTTSWDPSTLAPGEATGAPIAEVRALMVRRDLAVPVLEVYVATEFARYVWETLSSVVAGLGGAPVGWQALRSGGLELMHPIRYFRPWRMWRHHELKDSYDVVIVGGGAHGLAIAYELAKRGIRDVAVLDKSYIGAGGSGRNTTIVRANYRTPEGVAFYKEALRLYEQLAQELDYNLLLSQQGHLTLAHAERAVIVAHERAEVNRLLGVDSRVIYPDEIAKLCPELDLSSHPDFPIMAALYHPPGGVIRHDAVVWAYARMADRMGVHVHQGTEVTGVERPGAAASPAFGRTAGDIATGTVISAVAGWTSEVCRMAGVETPIVTHPLQAFVTEALKPFLDVILVSATLHVYISQTDRGEVLIGSEIEPYTSYSQDSTLDFLEVTAAHTLELLPMLGRVKLMRAWGGLCDVTPDYSPIMGLTDVEGFLIDGGWGTYGFKATPIVGVTMADLVNDNSVPDLIAPFALERFWKRELVSEIAAAAVSH